MKYKLLFISLLLSGLAHAQMKQSMIVFGPKLGLQVNDLKIMSNPTKIKTKLSMQYQLGVFGRLNYNRFSLQPEAVFQVKGGNLMTSPSEKHVYRYLSTPILLGVSPLKGLYLEAGPEFNWALNAGVKKDGVLQYGPDAKNSTAVVAGARINLLDNFSMFSLNLRYVYGLTNTNERVEVDGQVLDIRNRTFQLSVTYNFSEYYKWWKKYGLRKPKK